ncbi:hypothetical protein B6I21_00530 [candidate division KSB1 bacterium 4572_119]|nr:MAG: hypothetical protein B6I21_00530 [candidate division KSB1 bacterium 4572_119]
MSFIILTPVIVTVQWNANIESDFAGYYIYKGTQSRHYDQVINVGKDTSYTFENLETGNRYYFTVTSYDTAGNESFYSEEVSVDLYEPNEKTDEKWRSAYYNFPNPFNPKNEVTYLRYFLEKDESTSINIYSAGERLVRQLLSPTLKFEGEHTEDFWDGKSDNGNYVPNGVYLGVIRTGEEKRIILISVIR